MIIACDFDGTIVTHEYPRIGKPIPFAIQTLKKLQEEDQHQIILWTVREGDLLQEAGYAPMVTQTGMILKLKEHSFAESPQVVRIGLDRIEEWGETCCRAFDKPPEQPAFEAMVRREDCYFYGFEEDGRLIGTTLLYTEDGNAGIHEVGVLPECRRRSVAGRLLRHALTQAKRDGAKIATLQASALGEPLYRALGFKAVSKLDTWIMPPQA